MCGICGYIAKEPVNDECLRRMNDTMMHRGPDDAGRISFQNRERYVGIAQRRLSIIDLSERGRQPMSDCSGDLIIAYNGEIYNYLELRAELSDYPYRSDTDTEVLLAAYRRWGADFIDRCNGMYAIALFDRSNGSLYLYRDRLGQKPLYYYYDEQTLVFASELKAIMEYDGIRLQINRRVLGRYLARQSIVSPDTIFRCVQKVRPGERVCVRGSEIEKKLYWDINTCYREKKERYSGDYEETKADFLRIMEAAVRRRMVADVPIGILLSGGYDSSLVAAFAKRSSNKSIRTYSIGIADPALDEAIYARKVAAFLGASHRELYVSETDMLSMVEKIPQYYDEPFADSSQIATMLVAGLAREEVTVVLTGDGGDELFAGYPIYQDLVNAQRLDMAGGLLYRAAFKGGEPREWYKSLPFSVRAITENRNPGTKTQFNFKTQAETAAKMLGYGGGEYYDESAIPESSWTIRRMLLDMQTYLPDDLHCKVDRASMMHSLEARSPFMDLYMVEFALSLPIRYKLYNGKGKRLLKDVAWDLYPRELLDRPKAGFSVPIASWLRKELRDDLIDISRETYLEKQGIFDPRGTQETVDHYLEQQVMSGRGQKSDQVIWAFYVFQKWLKRYESKVDVA